MENTSSSRPIPISPNDHRHHALMESVLERLNSEDYITIPHVALLDEHVMTGEDGSPLSVVDEKRLSQIASNNNRRIELTGDACPICIGHTKDGAAEKNQPPVVGFASNFLVDRFFKTGKKAIYADLHIRKDKYEEMKSMSPGWRRSVELWTDGRWEIDPVAMLSSTTPERDLGLLLFSRENVKSPPKLIRYARAITGETMPDEPKDQMPAEDTDAGDGGDEHIMALVKKCIQECLPSMLQEAMAGGQAGGEEGELPPGAEDGADGEAGYDDLLGPDDGAEPAYGPAGGMAAGGPPGMGSPHDEAAWMHGEEPMRYDHGLGGGYAYPSASNSYIPRSAPGARMNRQHADARARLQAGAKTVEERNKDKIIADLQSRLADMEKRERYSRRERDVQSLHAVDGFEIKPAELFDEVKDLAEPEYTARIGLVKKYARKSVVAQKPLETGPIDDGSQGPQADPQMARKIGSYISKHNMNLSDPTTFAKARQAVLGGHN